MKLTVLICSLFLRYFLAAFVLSPSVDALRTNKEGGAEEVIEVYFVDSDGEATTDVNPKSHIEENQHDSSHEDNTLKGIDRFC